MDLTAVEGEGEVSLSWDRPLHDNGYQIIGYRIYRGATPDTLVLLDEVGDVHEYSDLSAFGGTYYYRVAAVNVVGVGARSDPAEVSVEATVFAPNAPEDFDLDAGNGTVTLTWDPPDDDGGTPVLNYRIYRGTSPESMALLNIITLESGDQVTYVDFEVVNGQTYYYKVTAVNAVGEGAATELVDVTPSEGAGNDDGGTDLMLYGIIAVAAIAVAGGATLFLMRRKK